MRSNSDWNTHFQSQTSSFDEVAKGITSNVCEEVDGMDEQGVEEE